jgi:hypothetical protein
MIPQFQKFPMWMKHPHESDTGLKPFIVYNEEQEKEFKSKGYVSPNVDEAFFQEAMIQAALGKQLVSLIMASLQRTEYFCETAAMVGQIEHDHKQIRQTNEILESQIYGLKENFRRILDENEAMNVAMERLHRDFNEPKAKLPLPENEPSSWWQRLWGKK